MEVDTNRQICHDKSMRQPLDLTGKRFGYLTVLRRTDERLENSIAWECRCDCGNVRLFAAKLLTGRKRSSCGCRRSSARPRFEATCAKCGAGYQKSAWGISSPYCHLCRKENRREYERTWQRKDTSRAQDKARYQRNIAEGRCPNCGVRPAREGRLACVVCTARQEAK